MKTEKAKKFLLIILITVNALLLASCVYFVAAGSAEVTFSGGTQQAEYELGGELKILDGKFTADGKDYAADYRIILPDGRVYRTPSFILTQSGITEIEYYAVIGGKRYSHEVSVRVRQPLCSVEGTGSIEYGAYKVHNDELNIDEEISGVIASLYSGATLKYNKIIDLNKLNKNEPLITMNIIATEKGTPDFRRINVAVRDVHNPDNYLILRVKDKESDDGDYVGYATVGINNTYINYVNTSPKNDNYGKMCNFSFRRMPGLKGGEQKFPDRLSIAGDKLSFFLDEQENVVYKLDSNGIFTSVCDVGGCNVGWTGFTTGEVSLEVYADMYVGAAAKFVIRDVENKAMTERNLNDAEAPVITVDYAGYSPETVPDGLTGKEYRVFTATAYDAVDGLREVKTFVYKNFYSDNRISVNLSDGKFTPRQKGVYTVEYVSYDKSGNVRRLTCDIDITDVPVPITARFLPHAETGLQGEYVTVADVECSGGFGDKTKEVSVYYGTEKTELTDGRFFAMEKGAYTVTYDVADYVNMTERFSYEVQIAYNPEPVILTDLDAQTDRFFIAGYPYPIPETEVVFFSENGAHETVKADFTVDNGTFSGGIFTPAREGEVNFTYSHGGKTVRFVRKVYSVETNGALDMKKLFVTSAAADYSAEGYPRYVFAESGDMTFINPLLSEGFSFRFNTETGYNAVQKIHFFLTDRKNAAQTVKFTFNKVEDKVFFSVNDGASAVLKSSLTGYPTDDFTVSFSASDSAAVICGQKFNFSEYMSGEPFEGFDSNGIYCKISIQSPGANGFHLIVKAVQGITLSSEITEDDGEPTIAVLGEYGGLREINTVYTLPEAVAADLVSPYLKSFTVSVSAYDPAEGKNAAVRSVDGTELRNVPVGSYQFVLGQYGTYKITYRAEDYSGKYKASIFSVKVFDTQPPVITFDGKNEIDAKPGSAVKVQSVKVADNYCPTDKITVEVFVKSPSSVVSFAMTGTLNAKKENQFDFGEFTVDEKGVYTVYYYVYDTTDEISQGNMSIFSYVVNVG